MSKSKSVKLSARQMQSIGKYIFALEDVMAAVISINGRDGVQRLEAAKVHASHILGYYAKDISLVSGKASQIIRAAENPDEDTEEEWAVE